MLIFFSNNYIILDKSKDSKFKSTIYKVLLYTIYNRSVTGAKGGSNEYKIIATYQ